MPEVTDAGDGAPTALIQNLTGGELQDQNEIFISSFISCGETSFQARIYAIIGFINEGWGRQAYELFTSANLSCLPSEQ